GMSKSSWNCSFSELRNAYRAHGAALNSLYVFDDFLAALHAAGKLDYEGFRAAVLRFNLGFPQGVGKVYAPDHGSPAIWEFARRLAWETVQDLSDENLRIIDRFTYARPSGARWLVKGCEHIE